jgi:hypothetical protein
VRAMGRTAGAAGRRWRALTASEAAAGRDDPSADASRRPKSTSHSRAAAAPRPGCRPRPAIGDAYGAWPLP